MHLRRALTALGIASALALSTSAEAQLTQIGGVLDQSGGGLGAQATVLTLQTPGNATTGTGCVSPTGFANCGFPNSTVQQGQSQVVAASTFPGLTANNFRIVFNAAEPGNAENGITLNNLVVTLYGSGNNTFSTGALTAPVNLTPLAGVGNYGFVFGLTNPTEIAAFNAFLLANPTATIGVGAQISNAQGGLETFAIATSSGPGTVVPEPSTYLLMATGLVAVGLIARRRAA
ncbi:MAG: PEP-CTERM sorting domain-containing protein [Gemmatimonadota bacterium]